ncbi:Rpn family recombination-promoting nuclease/putative transposase [Lacrimispora sp.]|uniref:Rpn family recombination-promoting nuclease/putative transposase n=1 Tax=Lacrimispora sp. TaxID=2719234 RepID=UPI0032E43001
MTKYKPYEQLDLTDDFMFSYVMRSNSELCRQLLESILNFPIDRIDYIGSQETIDTYAFSKGLRLDIFAKSGNRSFDVELQTSNKKDLPQRSRYYQSQMDTAMLQKGQMYRELGESYIIFLCTFDPFGYGQYIYSFQNGCTELPTIALNDGAYKVFVNAQGTRGVIGDELKEFLLFLISPGRFKTGEKGQLVKKAIIGVEQGRRNEEWRLIYMTLITKFDELLAEGKEQGLAEGRREGRQEGLMEGEARFARLTENLLLEGKLTDLQRSISDTKFREQLYSIYKLSE